MDWCCSSADRRDLRQTPWFQFLPTCQRKSSAHTGTTQEATMLCSSTENYSGETYKPASQKNKQTKKTLNLFNLKKKKRWCFSTLGSWPHVGLPGLQMGSFEMSSYCLKNNKNITLKTAHTLCSFLATLHLQRGITNMTKSSFYSTGS